MNVVLCCGSAGAIEEFTKFAQEIPKGFNAAVVLLLHRTNSVVDQLVLLLQRKVKIPVVAIEHFMPIEEGKLYLVPGGYHCLLNKQYQFELDYSEKVLFCRPAADVSLESFSHVLGSALVAVIATGSNEDGKNGIQYVLKREGKVVIQNPEVAHYKNMPLAALNSVDASEVTLYENSLFDTLKTKIYGKS